MAMGVTTAIDVVVALEWPTLPMFVFAAVVGVPFVILPKPLRVPCSRAGEFEDCGGLGEDATHRRCS